MATVPGDLGVGCAHAGRSGRCLLSAGSTEHWQVQDHQAAAGPEPATSRDGADAHYRVLPERGANYARSQRLRPRSSDQVPGAAAGLPVPPDAAGRECAGEPQPAAALPAREGGRTDTEVLCGLFARLLERFAGRPGLCLYDCIQCEEHPPGSAHGSAHSGQEACLLVLDIHLPAGPLASASCTQPGGPRPVPVGVLVSGEEQSGVSAAGRELVPAG
mmetsp:Transcript_14389/g.34296  ORF Transcript_14389/g.34296 Transcript_14389/m.34296 type:complete len:217 (+) Transcript_14389:1652-2302(+)